MKQRIEEDSLGSIKIDPGVYWGAQTERSRQNFRIGQEQMPREMIDALAMIKKGAALVHGKLGLLKQEQVDAIVEGAEAILKGELADQFPLVVWQTGSGTHTNMNLNEVISNYANLRAGLPLGDKRLLHPNDDVNRSQSSNDTFPAAMHLSAAQMLTKRLIPSLKSLYTRLDERSEMWGDLLKIGRTHLMDATPISLGQEFSGYAAQLQGGIEGLENCLPDLLELPLGGTAVGTGLNAPPTFDTQLVQLLAKWCTLPFRVAPNKFALIAGCEAIVALSGALKRVALSLLKLASDIRMMGSGPRAGLGELKLPKNEPGSSIMPGKVNPTQCESISMLIAQVIGNDLTITTAASMGQFELNAARPVMIYNLLQSIQLLADGSRSFEVNCLAQLTANKPQLQQNLDRSLMLVTALTPLIGYDKAAQVALKALREDLTLKEATLQLGYLDELTFDATIDPSTMI